MAKRWPKIEMMPPGASGRSAVNPAPSTMPSGESTGSTMPPAAAEVDTVKLRCTVG